MRRSICFAEPHSALTGQLTTWKFSYTTATSLPKGTRFRFDLLSKGRQIDWQVPQVNLKEKKNLIWAEAVPGKQIPLKEVDVPNSFTPMFEGVLPAEIKAGDTLHIFIGSPSSTKEGSGNSAQTYVQRRRPFHLFLDPKGKYDFKDPEVFTLDVRGNVLSNIRIIAPSIVSKNKRFDVIVRFEDKFGNLTSNSPEGTLIELSYEHLRESLNWKLFVPETGFITLPNLYFNEPGVYKIQLHNTKTKEKFFSSPIKCFAEIDRSLYWGTLHGESEKIDSTENIEACLRHFRDEKAFQFFASSPFEDAEETSNEIWKSISTQVTEFNEDNRFVAVLGFQWFGNEPGEGLRQCLYLKDNKPILRKKDSKTNTLKKIYKGNNPKEFISIPCFTMGKGLETTFEDYSQEFERIVEIYNAWGSGECTKKEGNPRPIHSEKKNGVFETEKGSIRKALNNNCRFGFVAGGLDDRGVYSSFYEDGQVQYSPGLTAILAEEHTRESIMHALYHRACYATTGERIILGFSIAGAQMGSELSTKAKPGLVYNRHISAYVAGTAPIKEIAIFRNGEVLHKLHPKQPFVDFTFDDSEHLSKGVLRGTNERPHFVYYYMRVIQDDGHIGWTSPIWIDYPDFSTADLRSQPGDAKKKKTK